MKQQVTDILNKLGVPPLSGGDMVVHSPIDGTEIGSIRADTTLSVNAAIDRAATAFTTWRAAPPPVRGELVRLFGDELRAAKNDLGRLVTIETGKILAEGQGEVQEMIDICDFAVGLSRQLYGLTIATERPGHHMREMWHPLGPVGIISAFNFPVAVWAWNTALAIVCGNPVVWKPSEKTPLSALACQALFDRAVAKFGRAPAHLSQIVQGGRDIGAAMSAHPDLSLISATGSTAMGRTVSEAVAKRLGRSLLELGGNAGMILTPSADQALALRAIVFSACGTAGQRCTTLRRLIIQQDIADKFLPNLARAYQSLRVGNPLEPDVLIGPLIDGAAAGGMTRALKAAVQEGGKILCGGTLVTGTVPAGGHYVTPAIVQMSAQTDIVRHETFAPILYVMTYQNFDEALVLHNAVPQGLSSCIFTGDMREAERFLSATGSDCGIANVNIGPSGAEIGGAFGGEKETGGGRESGSDAWKNYMRRQTQTVNYSDQLPLAQGVVFEV